MKSRKHTELVIRIIMHSMCTYMHVDPFWLVKHMTHLKYGREKKSNITEHAIKNNYAIDKNCLKLLNLL